MKQHQREQREQREQLAIRHYSQGHFDDAKKLCDGLIAQNSKSLLAWNIKGAICVRKEDFEGAEKCIRHALLIRKNSDSYFNLGLACNGQQKVEEAISAYRSCLKLANHAQASGNLANLLKQERQFEEAEQLYRQAIQVNPAYGFAWSNLGGLLVQARRYAEAETVLRQAVTLLPDLMISHIFLGEALEKLKKNEEALAVYQAGNVHGRALHLLRQQADWRALTKVDAAYLQDPFPARLPPSPPWSAIMVPGLAPQMHREMGRRFALFEYPAALAVPPGTFPAHSGQRLRIGYLSADFSNHATMHLLAGVLETHDPEVVDVHLFSYGLQAEDLYTRRIDAMPVTWHDIQHLPDRLAAARISATRIDVLVDLKGYTTNGRQGINALRPAPVIVSWLGYPGSLGHERLADFIIGDSVVTPVEHAAHFSETIAMMPFCYQPNDRKRTRGSLATRAGSGLPAHGFVFCCFNQIVKINPVDFDIWSRLLGKVAGSVLWLLDPKSERTRNNLRREMQARGVDAGRLVFAPFCPPAEHIGRLRLADLFLDTQQCNAHTTASDALWAGVPVVTRIGDLFASRVAASLLTAHGFAELITHDSERYFEVALALAQDPARLRALRDRLDHARLHSRLFDTEAFTRDLERLYHAIWQQHAIPRNERQPIVLSD